MISDGSRRTYGSLRERKRYHKRLQENRRPIFAEAWLSDSGRWFTLSWKRNGTNIGWIKGRATDEAVILSYKHRRGELEEWKSEEYPVGMSHSPCNYGGERPWLHCPARG